MRAVPVPGRFPMVTESNVNVKPWQQCVADIALGLGRLPYPRHTPIVATMNFFFLRPASIPKRRLFPTVKPDVDKTSRAILDAIKGVLLGDDAQVVGLFACKFYAAPGTAERVEIKLAAVAAEIPKPEQAALFVEV